VLPPCRSPYLPRYRLLSRSRSVPSPRRARVSYLAAALDQSAGKGRRSDRVAWRCCETRESSKRYRPQGMGEGGDESHPRRLFSPLRTPRQLRAPRERVPRFAWEAANLLRINVTRASGERWRRRRASGKEGWRGAGGGREEGGWGSVPARARHVKFWPDSREENHARCRCAPPPPPPSSTTDT